MNQTIYEQTQAAIAELYEKAKLQAGSIVVIGCSTSEVTGSVIGTNSNPDTAGEIFNALHDFAKAKGIFLAVQCCEHLNRAIITERNAVPFAEIVSVIPQPRQAVRLQQRRMQALKIPLLLRKSRQMQGLTSDLR